MVKEPEVVCCVHSEDPAGGRNQDALSPAENAAMNSGVSTKSNSSFVTVRKVLADKIVKCLSPEEEEEEEVMNNSLFLP